MTKYAGFLSMEIAFDFGRSLRVEQVKFAEFDFVNDKYFP